MKYVYIVEIKAVKELVIEADSSEEADAQADLITSTETIPVEQDDIIDIELFEGISEGNGMDAESYRNYLT